MEKELKVVLGIACAWMLFVASAITAVIFGLGRVFGAW